MLPEYNWGIEVLLSLEACMWYVLHGVVWAFGGAGSWDIQGVQTFKWNMIRAVTWCVVLLWAFLKPLDSRDIPKSAECFSITCYTGEGLIDVLWAFAWGHVVFIFE